MKILLIHEYLERLSNLLRMDERRSGTDFGLQPVQLEALHYVAMCNRYSDTPLAVAEYLGLTKGTVSQTLQVLEAKGLIFKVGDAEDKRVVHLKVTPLGRELLEKTIPAPLLRAAGERLSEAERQRIIDAMKTLLQACQAANQKKSFGVCHTCRHHVRQEEGGCLCGLLQQPLASDETLQICREHAA